MTKIKLIASDLDGTLLRNGARELREETCGLIAKLQEKGICFMASSGRQYDSLRNLFFPIRNEISYLTQNGASAIVQGKLLFAECMKKETADQLVDEVSSMEGVDIMLGAWNCGYLPAGNDRFFRVLRDEIHTHAEPVPDLHAYTHLCSRISLYEEDGIRDLSFWQKKYGRDFMVVTGGRQWADMMPKHVNKGTALRRILRCLSIPEEEVLVLGDQINDLEILKLAGLSATVPDAVREVEEMTDVMVNTVEEMFAQILAGRDQIEDWKKQ